MMTREDICRLNEIGPDAYADEVKRGFKAGKLPSFAGETVSALWDLADEPVDWMVDGVFAMDQPTVFGARKKSLKTTILSDLAVSLATGTKWLSHFKVPKVRKTLFITGEANSRAAIRRARRAIEARAGGSRNTCKDNLHIEAMSVPKLANAGHREGLKNDVERHGFEVIILDPLYRAMSGSTNAGNLFDVGELLGCFQECCRPASIVISHHLKASAKFDTLPDLDDLSQAGISEFAGNYWLAGRLDEYRGDGKHNLAFAYGGRDEQFGTHRLLFDERDWSAGLTDLEAYQQASENERQQRDENAKVNRIREKILKALRHGPMPSSGLAEASGTKPSREVFMDALSELESSKQIERIPDFKSGNHKTCTAWKINHGQSQRTTAP